MGRTVCFAWAWLVLVVALTVCLIEYCRCCNLKGLGVPYVLLCPLLVFFLNFLWLCSVGLVFLGGLHPCLCLYLPSCALACWIWGCCPCSLVCFCGCACSHIGTCVPVLFCCLWSLGPFWCVLLSPCQSRTGLNILYSSWCCLFVLIGCILVAPGGAVW